MTRRPFAQIDVGPNLYFGINNMGLYNHLVCPFSHLMLKIMNALHSDGEMAFFWQAKRQLRLSPARVLFMLVSFCAG
jgi:hypothetical protein